MAIDSESQNYLTIKQSNLDKCINIDNNYICEQNRPIYHINDNVICEIQAYVHTLAEQKQCETRYICTFQPHYMD